MAIENAKERKKDKYNGKHDFHLHDLVRCAERAEAEVVATVEDRLSQLESRFANHEETMNAKFSRLEGLLENLMNNVDAIRSGRLQEPPQ